ncbi:MULTISPECIES: helix-turn-helix domain-containing protein [Pseudomonadota]|uniref:helix-turn-helix domain-containing protein n=1 Tax=Pseudomonadota TaxID=1224 RepID=UPI00094423DC|nr:MULTISPECIES: helix-turn-helix transcriptional regulator [Pseudomonadota]
MQKRSIQRGRPSGTKTYEPDSAFAFGTAVRMKRTEQGTAQETLAHRAGIERSHMGKIERGEHMPTLAIFLRIAEALGCTATNLMADTEINLSEIKKNKKPPA